MAFVPLTGFFGLVGCFAFYELSLRFFDTVA
jgi:hypothetical protein